MYLYVYVYVYVYICKCVIALSVCFTNYYMIIVLSTMYKGDAYILVSLLLPTFSNLSVKLRILYVILHCNVSFLFMFDLCA